MNFHFLKKTVELNFYKGELVGVVKKLVTFDVVGSLLD